MKKLILLSFFAFIFQSGFSQYLEVGMELQYVDPAPDWFPPDSPPVWSKMIVEKDTIIDGEQAFCIHWERDNCNYDWNHYFGQDSTRLYFYDEEGKHLFHDYSLKSGDTLRTRHLFPQIYDSLYILVDSVGIVSAQGKDFKIQYLNSHIEPPRGVQNYAGVDYYNAVEGVGSLFGFFFASPVASPNTNCLYSVTYPGEGTFIFDNQCRGILSSEDIDLGSKISLSPNPASDFLKINFEKPLPQSVRFSLFDVSGKSVQEFYIEKNQLETRLELKAQSGFYFYKIETESGAKKTGKLVLE